MSAGLVASVWRAYRDPRGAMARRMAEGLSEPQALVHLFLACGLGFVARMPDAAREAQDLAIPDALSGVISAHLFGYFFVAPLLLYALAAAVHLVARGFGGRVRGFLPARAALFWAALLAAPIALALALIRAAAEIAAGAGVLPWLDYLGYAGLVFWLWLLAATLAEAEGFRATLRVAAVLAMVFVGLAAGLGTLAGTAPVAG